MTAGEPQVRATGIIRNIASSKRARCELVSFDQGLVLAALCYAMIRSANKTTAALGKNIVMRHSFFITYYFYLRQSLYLLFVAFHLQPAHCWPLSATFLPLTRRNATVHRRYKPTSSPVSATRYCYKLTVSQRGASQETTRERQSGGSMHSRDVARRYDKVIIK